MKEAFEKIKECLKKNEEYNREGKEEFCGTDGEVRFEAKENAYAHALSIVSEVEAEYGNGWIPCSERLPEECGRYLVCNDGVAWIADFFNSTWFGKRCRYSDVIAWQPLPTPYKEGDHAKKN